jgi:hypothetical protein
MSPPKWLFIPAPPQRKGIFILMNNSIIPPGESTKAIDQEKIEYQRRIEAQLRDLDARIHKLEAKTAEATAETLIEGKKQLRRLRTKREEMRDHIRRLKNASDDAWVDLKMGIDNALAELKAAFKAASSRFE